MNFIQYMIIYVLSMVVFAIIGYLACRQLRRPKERIVITIPASVDKFDFGDFFSQAQQQQAQTEKIPSAWIRQVDAACGLELDVLAAAHFPEIARGGRTDDQFRKELFREYVALHDLAIND